MAATSSTSCCPGEEVVVFDNLSSGDEAHLAHVLDDELLPTERRHDIFLDTAKW